MITVKSKESEEVIVKPTLFPDGTSQVWKIPEHLLGKNRYYITWNFEAEREIMDLHSLVALLRFANPYHIGICLHIPFLPYSRQDKKVSNDTTFNLGVFSTLINNLGFEIVTSMDVHNPDLTTKLFYSFINHGVGDIHREVVKKFEPTFIVYPDKGAMARYENELSHIRTIFCDKVRCQDTGKILGLTVNSFEQKIEPGSRLLIIDDICDGGATFIQVAKVLRELEPNITVGLFVTHGIFSKGKQHLIDNGINEIYTTNSLLKNTDGIKV